MLAISVDGPHPTATARIAWLRRGCLMRLIRIWMFVALALSATAWGCKEDPMDRARAAHAMEKADEAEEALEKVLAENPKDFEARRLMADVHRYRGEYEKTEDALEELWKEKGFDDEEKELSPEERARRDLLENQFNELYTAWSDAIDPEKEPEKFQEVVQAGLKWNEKSPSLNRKLVDFHLARAKKFAEEGERIKAAEQYEAILQLRTLPKQREDAKKKASELRMEAFAEQVKKRFEEEVKARLIEAELWDAETERIELEIEADVDRGLRQRNEEDLVKARKQAARAIRTAIAKLVAQVTDVEDIVALNAAIKMKSGDESLRRGKYEVTVSMTLDDVIAGAFKAQEKARAAAEKAEKEKGDDDAKKDAAEGDEEKSEGAEGADEGEGEEAEADGE
jgi:hypothetical protein